MAAVAPARSCSCARCRAKGLRAHQAVLQAAISVAEERGQLAELRGRDGVKGRQLAAAYPGEASRHLAQCQGQRRALLWDAAARL